MSKTKNIMPKWHNISKKDKFLLITNLIPETEMRRLLEEEHYSFGMIKDLLQRDYLVEGVNEITRAIISAPQHQTFSSILKENGLFFSLEKYNKKPQAWKVQFRFPKTFTIDQIGEEIRRTSREGQQITVARRKQNDSYANREFRSEWSPLMMDFYLSRGWTVEQAERRLVSIRTSGAKAALKRCQKPSTECKIAAILGSLMIAHSSQFELPNENPADKRSCFIYDFLLPDTKTIIEVNGDYFHANPIFYKEEDVIHLPSGPQKVSDLWAKDKRKIDFAISKGYNVLVIWEYDLNHRPDKIIKETIIKCLNS
jgi:very-short-patch-repair endonuclease